MAKGYICEVILHDNSKLCFLVNNSNNVEATVIAMKAGNGKSSSIKNEVGDEAMNKWGLPPDGYILVDC